MKSDPSMGDAQTPFSEEFLEALALDLVLQQRSEQDLLRGQDAGQKAALRALLVDPSFQERLHSLRSWVGDTREQLGDWQGGDDDRAAALSPAILELSTRRPAPAPSLSRDAAPDGLQDGVSTGVWGDAMLLLGFARRRLASSVALRLAAASLLAHLIALPALAAYIYWVQPKDSGFTLRFDPGQVVLPEESTGLAPMEELEDDSDLWSALGLQETNAIASARYGLTHMELDGLYAGLQGPWAPWIEVRLRRLEEGAPPVSLQGQRPGQPAGFGHILAFEMVLDDWVLGRGEAPTQEAWWAPLIELVSVSQAQSDASAPLARLAGMALVRAHGYGLLLDHGNESTLTSRQRDEATGSPLGPAWFDLVRSLRATSESNENDGAWRAWGTWFEAQGR